MYFKILTLITHTISIMPCMAQVPKDEIVHQKKICKGIAPSGPCDSTYQLPLICNSTKAVEVRLISVDWNGMRAEEVAIGCDSAGLWSGIKAHYEWYYKNDKRVFIDTMPYQIIQSDVPLDTIYSLLKRYDLLTMDSNKAIDHQRPPGDSVFHQVSVKIGNRFRGVRFRDADQLAKLYPEEPFHKNCSAIFHLIKSL